MAAATTFNRRHYVMLSGLLLFIGCSGLYIYLLIQSSVNLDWNVADMLLPQTPIITSTPIVHNSTSNAALATSEFPELDEKASGAHNADEKLTDSSMKNQTGICNNYRGILHIRHGDEFAASGTLFFVYIINHILYAKQYNLLPWIHLDPQGVCYDVKIHGNSTNVIALPGGMATACKLKFLSAKVGKVCGNAKRPKSHPGDIHVTSNYNSNNRSLPIYGNGIWPSYFEPLLQNDWYNDPSCQQLPLVQIDPELVSPGMHRCAEWAVRPWQVVGMPPRLSAQWRKITLHAWFGEMRQRAYAVVAQYYRPQPWLQQEIESANPSNRKCLAMHIRMTDKGHGRTLIPLEAFLPYAQAYTDSTATARGSDPKNYTIYLATDDSHLLERLEQSWPKQVVERIVYRTNTLRSPGNATAVFDLHASNRHRTNTEALVEVYAMSRCQFIVHGYSAMAEAAIYINYPILHNHSVCLENEQNMSVAEFQSLVMTTSEHS